MLDDIDRDVCHDIKEAILEVFKNHPSICVDKVEDGDPTKIIILKAKSDAWRWRATVKVQWGEEK